MQRTLLVGVAVLALGAAGGVAARLAPSGPRGADCCLDPACPPGCSEDCPPGCLTGKPAGRTPCCPPGEVCPDCLSAGANKPCRPGAVTTSEEEECCPPCPCCPGR